VNPSAVVLAVVLASCAARGQDSRPAPPPDLRAAVDAFLGERDDAAAASLLEALLRRPDATADHVAAAIVASDGPLARESTLLVPHRDQLLATTVRVPEGHARAGPRLPVVFDVAEGQFASWFKHEGAIVAFVKGYTPPEFSDEGRDGFLKALRRAAHAAHGDPGRLWLSGFSWAAHASWDVSLHRPGFLRGIVTGGGGPRLVWFRLLPQLAPERVRAFCGGNDDQKLIWNLREVGRLAPKHELDYALVVDPARGHDMPLAGIDAIPELVQKTGPLASNPMTAASGTLLADAAMVESPLLRIDGVDEARVAAKPVPVSATASDDDQRRATLAAWSTKVAKLSWRIENKKDETAIALTGDGVTAATVFLRAPQFQAGRKVTVRAGAKAAFSEVLAPDPKTMLSEARRTGDRLRPVMKAVPVRFGR
jgi:hypothetical protein